MANPLASVSISLRSLHDETPDPFDLCGGLALLLGRQATRLDIRRPDWRQINPRIRRDVADRLCVAYDHGLDIGMREGLEGLTQALVFKCDRRPLTLIAAGRNGQSETSPLCASRDHEQYERLDREGLRLSTPGAPKSQPARTAFAPKGWRPRHTDPLVVGASTGVARGSKNKNAFRSSTDDTLRRP